MKKLLIAFILVGSLSSMVVTDVYARRFGGSSFGRQSSNVNRMTPKQVKPANPAQQKQAAANKQQAQQGTNTAAPANRWGGMIGGALLGLGLGALLANLGIGGEMAGMISTILTLLLLFFVGRGIFRLLSRKRQPAYQQSGYATESSHAPGHETPGIGSGLSHTMQRPSSFQSLDSAATIYADENKPMTWHIPDDFDKEAFIRAVKSWFIRMQAAWDKADINDIQEFTTPQMFAEMKWQIQERGSAPNVTEVTSLDAQMLGIETIGNEFFASVKFSGMVRENGDVLSPFEEVWNLTRPVSQKQGWVLAGVQQLS